MPRRFRRFVPRFSKLGRRINSLKHSSFYLVFVFYNFEARFIRSSFSSSSLFHSLRYISSRIKIRKEPKRKNGISFLNKHNGITIVRFDPFQTISKIPFFPSLKKESKLRPILSFEIGKKKKKKRRQNSLE